MALPFTITKAKFDALDEKLKTEYVVGEKDGEYVLDVTGLPVAEDVDPIKRTLEKVRGELKTAKSELATAKSTIADMPNVEDINATHAKEVAKYKTFTEKTLIDGTAMTLATAVSKSPKLLAKDIRERFEVDLSGDEPVVRIKGADGKIDAAMTIDKLRAEVVANPDYKDIIIASRASGGGTPTPTPSIKPLGAGGGQDGEQPAKPDLSKMSPKDLAARITANRVAAAAQQQQS